MEIEKEEERVARAHGPKGGGVVWEKIVWGSFAVGEVAMGKMAEDKAAGCLLQSRILWVAIFKVSFNSF